MNDDVIGKICQAMGPAPLYRAPHGEREPSGRLRRVNPAEVLLIVDDIGENSERMFNVISKPHGEGWIFAFDVDVL